MLHAGRVGYPVNIHSRKSGGFISARDGMLAKAFLSLGPGHGFAFSERGSAFSEKNGAPVCGSKTLLRSESKAASRIVLLALTGFVLSRHSISPASRGAWELS